MTLPVNPILEGIVTTAAGRNDPLSSNPVRNAPSLDLINIAPMGPLVDAAITRLTLRPFTSSTTYKNLKATGEGVFHVTDDALLIARGAMGRLAVRWADESRPDDAAAAAGESDERGRWLQPVRRADVVRGVVLVRACRYYEFVVTDLDDSNERTRIEAKVVNVGLLRDFFGFNRARHAVLEAAILATRLHLTGAAPVLAEFDRLMVAVEKTGGADEHQAMAELRAFVEGKLRVES